MSGPHADRLTGIALRCYPQPWRRRHGAEAAELAVLLIRDGTPARSIAWSYLQGAARERLTPKPGHRLAAAAAVLLAAACSLGVPLGLLSASAPASASSAGRPASPSSAAHAPSAARAPAPRPASPARPAHPGQPRPARRPRPHGCPATWPARRVRQPCPR